MHTPPYSASSSSTTGSLVRAYPSDPHIVSGAANNHALSGSARSHHQHHPQKRHNSSHSLVRTSGLSNSSSSNILSNSTASSVPTSNHSSSLCNLKSTLNKNTTDLSSGITDLDEDLSGGTLIAGPNSTTPGVSSLSSSNDDSGGISSVTTSNSNWRASSGATGTWATAGTGTGGAGAAGGGQGGIAMTSGYQTELHQKANARALLGEVMEDQVQRLQCALQESQLLSGQMDLIMSGFEHQLGRLERRIDPIHRRTTVLRRTHIHIDQTLLLAEKYLDRYTAAHRIEAPLLAGMHGDYESYLDSIAVLDSCIHFFSVNRGFRSADARLARLRELEKAATQECEREFVHTLTLISKPFQIPAPIPKRLVIVPQGKVAMLCSLSKALSRAPNIKTVYSAYVNARHQCLVNSITTHCEQLLKDSEKDRSQLLFYRKDSHAFVHLLHLLILILQHEKRLARTIFSPSSADRSNNYSSKLYRQQYVQVVAPLVEIVIDTGLRLQRGLQKAAHGGESSLASSSSRRSARLPAIDQQRPMFALFDILGNYLELQPQYRRALEGVTCSSLCNKLDEFSVQLRNTCGQTLVSFLQVVQVTVLKTVPPSGTVSNLTLDTLGFLKNLVDFDSTTLDDVFKSWSLAQDSSAKTAPALSTPEISNVTDFIRSVLKTLVQRISSIASKEKEPLATVFLLNNLDFVLTTLRESELAYQAGDRVINELERQLEEHQSAWLKRCKPLWAVLRTGTNTLLKHTSSNASGGKPLSKKDLLKNQKTTIKETLRAFYSSLSQLVVAHKPLCIKNPELWKWMTEGLKAMLLPRYERFLLVAEPVESTAKHLKLTKEEVALQINQLLPTS